MHSKPAVKCPDHVIGTKGQTVWIKRGGIGKASGSGPSGYKVKPARLLARSLAEMAAVYRTRKK